jgi:dipeptidyl aminopeptidase/acylaminoacyl peptidase
MLLTSDRLKGQWGIVDVQDTIEAVKQLSASPYALIDPKRLCIRGGSAGGFTVLAALCDKENPTVFAAGTSSYGVSDLKRVRESLVVADC